MSTKVSIPSYIWNSNILHNDRLNNVSAIIYDSKMVFILFIVVFNIVFFITVIS